METLGVWIAAALTLCIFSFLYKDNPFYKFAEHLFVGIAAGYGIVIQAKDGLEGTILEPIGEAAAAGQTGEIILIIIPVLIGFFFFAQFVPNYAWLVRIPFALIIGYGAGLALPRLMEADIFKQVHSTLLSFTTFDQAGSITVTLLVFIVFISALIYLFSTEHRGSVRGSLVLAVIIIVVLGVAVGKMSVININKLLVFSGIICTLTYFFFSAEHRGFVGGVSKVGIIFIMISFGAAFGNTVMGRVSLLIGRIYFLLHDWLPLI